MIKIRFSCRIEYFYLLFCLFCIATPLIAKPLGSTELEQTITFKPAKSNFYCGFVKNKWLPGRIIKRTNRFYPHAAERKNVIRKASKAKGAIKTKLLQKSVQLANLIKIRTKLCNGNTNSNGKSLRFDFSNSVGLLLYSYWQYFPKKIKDKWIPRSGSNLYKILANGQVAPAISSGKATIVDAEDDQTSAVYISFERPIDLNDTTIQNPKPGCILAKVDRKTGIPTCIENGPGQVPYLKLKASYPEVPEPGSGPLYYELIPVNASRGNSEGSDNTEASRTYIKRYLNGQIFTLFDDYARTSSVFFPNGYVAVVGNYQYPKDYKCFRLLINDKGQSIETDIADFSLPCPINSDKLRLLPDNNFYRRFNKRWEKLNLTNGQFTKHDPFTVFEGSPKPIPAQLGIKKISKLFAGYRFNIAQTTDGEMINWGNSLFNHDKFDDRRIIQPINHFGSEIRDIATDSDNDAKCVLTANGAVRCWGRNSSGLLGNDGEYFQPEPSTIASFTNGARSISMGGTFACAVDKNSAAKCWGRNLLGRLGIGSLSPYESSLPLQVLNLTSGVAQISLGYSHACALLTSGVLKCWGSHSYGQLGIGSKLSTTSPADVVGLPSPVQQVKANEHNTCALTTQGKVYCWGRNNSGQVGDGTFNYGKNTPQAVLGLTEPMTSIAVGKEHVCALSVSGQVSCWGNNNYGQLGDGTYQNRNIAVPVNGITGNAIQIVAGISHTCALNNQGQAQCWGTNLSQQLGNWNDSSKFYLSLKKGNTSYTYGNGVLLRTMPTPKSYLSELSKVESALIADDKAVLIGEIDEKTSGLSIIDLQTEKEQLIVSYKNDFTFKPLLLSSDRQKVVFYAGTEGEMRKYQIAVLDLKTKQVSFGPLNYHLYFSMLGSHW